MTKVLAVIPARGGSKSVPRKNIKLLQGVPLIAHTIKLARSSSLIERVIVSTDDQEIAEVAKEFGAEVPFIRPVELAQDDTPDQPVFKHALQWLNTQDNYQPEVVLHLRCTTPFKTETDIAQVLEKMAITNADSVRTMSRIEGKYHPYWTYKTGENGWAVPFLDGVDMAKYFQRQLLPKAYFLNGLVDAIKPDIILNHQNFWGDNIGLVETSAKRAIDIDTPDDFEYAEFLMRKNAGNTN